MSNIKEIEYHYKNSIDSLRELLSVYGKIVKDHKNEEVILKIFVKNITTLNLTWPSEENMCFKTLNFAVEQMETDLITIEIEHE